MSQHDGVARVRIVTSASDMVSVRGLWNELARGRTIFQSFLWSQAAAWQFAARERPHIVVAETKTGAAIIPAVVRRERVSLLGETLFDYRDLMCTGDLSSIRAGLSEVAELWRPMEIVAVRGDCSVQTWDGLTIAPFASAPGILREDLDADAFTARHRKLGRLSRRIGRSGITLQRYPGSNSSLIRTIYERKARQANGTQSLFADQLRRDFMQSICALERGCEVFTYEENCTLVAALVTFRTETIRHFYTICFDPSYAQYSPGQVLLYEVARLSLEDGLDCDFMTGSSGYKDRLATRHVPLYRVTASSSELRQFIAGGVTKAA